MLIRVSTNDIKCKKNILTSKSTNSIIQQRLTTKQSLVNNWGAGGGARICSHFWIQAALPKRFCRFHFFFLIIIVSHVLPSVKRIRKPLVTPCTVCVFQNLDCLRHLLNVLSFAPLFKWIMTLCSAFCTLSKPFVHCQINGDCFTQMNIVQSTNRSLSNPMQIVGVLQIV